MPKGAAAVKFHRKRRDADRARRSQLARCLKIRFRFEASLSRIFTERSMFRIATFYARIVCGAASRCDMYALKTDRAARGIFGASRKQRRSCGHAKFERAICRAPRRDRAWFRALAVSCVEFMRGLGEIVRRALLNLKRAAVVKPICRDYHKTKTP